MRIYTLLRKHNLDIYLYHQQIILLLISSYKFRSLNPFLVVIISFFVSIIISIFIAKIIESIKMAKLITK
jgi:peptidoglycan/LPS O-acetylase OafA/YrhL